MKLSKDKTASDIGGRKERKHFSKFGNHYFLNFYYQNWQALFQTNLHFNLIDDLFTQIFNSFKIRL